MEPYTPKPGTGRATLFDECKKFDGEFAPGDLVKWAEKKLGWSPHVTRQEVRVLHKRGVLDRISRGVYRTTDGKTKHETPKTVQKIVRSVVKRDTAEAGGDRFGILADAVTAIADALKPLTPQERENVVSAFGIGK